MTTKVLQKNVGLVIPQRNLSVKSLRVGVQMIEDVVGVEVEVE
jgi:hypothetical protein